ncbi:carboxypeptidase regulatory-like domain-containing protein [Trinickia dabaoshanensis]|nr:carboxypeptidase regulatory-like domain-containing protein [Trinickia dabaoshanensis]TAM50876.1 MAG: carboxypeptidase regulatory-like domain-containing protein [Paraburkholderia sp.]
MKHRSLASMVVVVIAGLGIATLIPARAQTGSPHEHVQGSTTYVSGGIGMDEVAAIKQLVTHYPLELEFARHAATKNEYVSDVKVIIKDHTNKTVLNATSDGPFMLVKLPQGRYAVSTERNGVSQQRAANVTPGQHERLLFLWPQ